jgi:hypothetical protein
VEISVWFFLCSNYLFSRFQSKQIKGEKDMCQPRNIFIKTLINNSLSNEFDLSMTEWIGIGEISRFELNFTPNCELCGAAVYKCNHVIYNVKTKKVLKIGSECIKRFESNTEKHQKNNAKAVQKLRKRHKQKQIRIKLIDQYHFISHQIIPSTRLFKEFRRDLIRLLKSYNKLHWLESHEGATKVLTKVLKKTEYTEMEVKRLELILHEPKKANNIVVRTPRVPRKVIDKYGIVLG